MIKDGFTVIHDWFYDKTIKINPLKDYSLQYYGDGRLVSLVLNNKEKLYRNRSGLNADYIDEEGYEAVQFFRVLLHIPKGKDSFELFLDQIALAIYSYPELSIKGLFGTTKIRP